MPEYRHILDNQSGTVADFLERSLEGAAAFDLVSAYFSIYGYQRLADQLDRVGKVRFLFGEPSSADDPDPGGKEPKSFQLLEDGLTPNHALAQKFLARRCAEWVGGKAVSVRSVSRSNFLHGKMYLTEGASGARTAVAGSSNFTQRGLGGGEQANLEINLAVRDAEVAGELREWFDRLWNDRERTRDVKRQVLDALNRIGEDYAPEPVYYKTLYELFRDEIDERREGDSAPAYAGLYQSAIWNTLYEFQKEGAKSVIARLRKHNGCILADSVGLGKTYTALAVIKYFEQRNERALVLCPKKLQENWSLYPVYNGHAQNPFSEDRFAYTVLAHSDLSRDSGKSGSVDLGNFNWGAYDLVVIDESHNFRNDRGQRYERLLEEVIKQGVKTKVLMLSATPVNISLLDLRNQIYLMTEGRDQHFRESLGVGDIESLMREAQRRFNEWEADRSQTGHRDKEKLLENLGPGFFRLLGAVSISRSRHQIELVYGQEMERIGGFPEREEPDNRYPPTDLRGELSYDRLVDRINEFQLAVYRPSDYLIDESRMRELEREKEEQNFNQQDRERFLMGMIRTNFLKRLESSAYALTLTLGRTINKIEELLGKMDRYQRGTASEDLAEADFLPDEEDVTEDEGFVNQGKRPYRLRELDLNRWRRNLEGDIEILAAARDDVAAITPERDGKLAEIKQVIGDKWNNPTTDQDGRTIRKMLVFTTFKDTAEYLYENLSGLAAEAGVNIAMVSGDGVKTTVGENRFHAVLSNFAPGARGRRGEEGADEIDLLIATDCISEGQNLQDCDAVVNYDIHWNPVRLIQRFGRIDRIGSRNPSVRMVNFWPTKHMDLYLNLQGRVEARMALADAAASGEDDPLTEEGVQMELNFRYEQLKQMREEILDLDDLDDSPSMSDFTLDYFFTQLLLYLDKNREALERMPPGAYAVAEEGAAPARPGVVFFLRLRNAGSDSGGHPASPVHPYYAVYIRDDGHIRFGCGNTGQILSLFESVAAGRTQPNLGLCDLFGRETDQGRNMAAYDKLLRDCIAGIRQAHDRKQTAGLGRDGARDFVLPRASEAPRSASAFDLVTWLIIKPTEQQAG